MCLLEKYVGVIGTEDVVGCKNLIRRQPTRGFIPDLIDNLHERIKEMYIDCRDALVLLGARTVKRRKMHTFILILRILILLVIDVLSIRKQLDTLLLEQAGRVAVSGFEGDRPRLEDAGWRTAVFNRKVTFASQGSSTKKNVKCYG